MFLNVGNDIIFQKKKIILTYWKVQKKWSKKNGFQQHQPWSPDTLGNKQTEEKKTMQNIRKFSVCSLDSEFFAKGTFTSTSIMLPQ